jgi:hypothetical protein
VAEKKMHDFQMVGNMQFNTPSDHITPSNPYERFMISIIERLDKIERQTNTLGKGLEAVASIATTNDSRVLYMKTGNIDPSTYVRIREAIGDCFVGPGSIQAIISKILLQNIEKLIKDLAKIGVDVESISVRSRLEIDNKCLLVSDAIYKLENYKSASS